MNVEMCAPVLQKMTVGSSVTVDIQDPIKLDKKCTPIHFSAEMPEGWFHCSKLLEVFVLSQVSSDKMSFEA
jgi:hypothetical protein